MSEINNEKSIDLDVSIKRINGKYALTFTSSDDLTIDDIQEVILGLFNIAKKNHNISFEEFLFFMVELEIYLFADKKNFEQFMSSN